MNRNRSVIAECMLHVMFSQIGGLTSKLSAALGQAEKARAGPVYDFKLSFTRLPIGNLFLIGQYGYETSRILRRLPRCCRMVCTTLFACMSDFVIYTR